MEGLTLGFICALLVDFVIIIGAGNFPRNHHEALLQRMRDLPRPKGHRRIGHHHSNKLPLYMMQLYRTLLADDSARAPAVTAARTRSEDNPRLHDSDSVISLVAKSK